MSNKTTFGIVGLGRMGGALALQAIEKGMAVAGVNKSGVAQELTDAGVHDSGDMEGLCHDLEPPRVILLYVPAGAIVDSVFEDLAPHLDRGDVIADGGNSYWGDSVRRCKRLKKSGVHFCDLGTSGGVDGARHGACFMIGGEDEPVAQLEPILRKLAVDGGYVHAGPPGAGHFTKLVHNGIEFGMLQAIGEGVSLLEHYFDELPVADILSCWRNGSVIRSWLIELLEAEYRKRGGLRDVPPHVEDTGEVNRLVGDALRMEQPIPVITQSVLQLFASRDESRDWARAIAMMRHRFGGHPYGEDESIRKERRTSRVEPAPVES